MLFSNSLNILIAVDLVQRELAFLNQLLLIYSSIAMFKTLSLLWRWFCNDIFSARVFSKS